jgi:hypothetical protein
MKRLSLLLLLSIASLSACKKGTGTDVVTPVDPREQLVGTYSMQGTIRRSSPPFELPPDQTNGTLTVTKATESDQIKIEINMPDFKKSLTAKLDKNTFTVLDKITETVSIESLVREANVTSATGEFFQDNTMRFNTTAEYAGQFTMIKKRDLVGNKNKQ